MEYIQMILCIPCKQLVSEILFRVGFCKNKIQEILIINLSTSLCIMDNLNLNESICIEGSSIPGGGGGWYSHFSSYVGSRPASTVHPQKYQEFQAPPPPPQKKIIEILASPKISPILYLDLKKRP